jgi:hypothetical protein
MLSSIKHAYLTRAPEAKAKLNAAKEAFLKGKLIESVNLF